MLKYLEQFHLYKTDKDVQWNPSINYSGHPWGTTFLLLYKGGIKFYWGVNVHLVYRLIQGYGWQKLIHSQYGALRTTCTITQTKPLEPSVTTARHWRLPRCTLVQRLVWPPRFLSCYNNPWHLECRHIHTTFHTKPLHWRWTISSGTCMRGGREGASKQN